MVHQTVTNAPVHLNVGHLVELGNRRLGALRSQLQHLVHVLVGVGFLGLILNRFGLHVSHWHTVSTEPVEQLLALGYLNATSQACNLFVDVAHLVSHHVHNILQLCGVHWNAALVDLLCSHPHRLLGW